MPEFNKEHFEELLDRFRFLNPEQMDVIEQELIELGAADNSKAFELTLATAEKILPLYLESPIKRAERASFARFFRIFTKTAKELAAKKDENEPEEPEPSCSMALVPSHHFDTLKWLQIEMASDIPDPVANAVAAGKRRNELLDSVLEPLFRLLLAFDEVKGLKWLLANSGSPDAPVDPDIARDMIRAWDTLGTVPADAIRKLLEWSADGTINRHWPAVAAEADRLLRKIALAMYPEKMMPPALKLLKPYDKGVRLKSWLKRGIATMGENITFFCDQAESMSNSADAGDDAWRRDSVFQELIQMQKNIRPLLIVSDLLLAHPDGALQFAMAVLGFTSSYKRQWRQRLIEQCRKAVRKCFLRDMRLKRKPHQTIHTLSFGDDQFEKELLSELDLFTESFSTIEQREEVVDRLAHMYASYREESLLMQEVGLRYRRMMRMLHQDNLNRLLSKEQQAVVCGFEDVLNELASIASGSRKFITRRRALDRATEEMLAADIDFALEIKKLRAKEIRKIIEGRV